MLALQQVDDLGELGDVVERAPTQEREIVEIVPDLVEMIAGPSPFELAVLGRFHRHGSIIRPAIRGNIQDELMTREKEFARGAAARAAGRRVGTNADTPLVSLGHIRGRLRASLDYSQIDEIMADSLQSYVRGIRKHCDLVHTALYQTYISYLTETALT